MKNKNKIVVVIEDKNCQPKVGYEFEGKVFIYNATNCLVVSCNEQIKKIYLEDDEDWTIYNYQEGL